MREIELAESGADELLRIPASDCYLREECISDHLVVNLVRREMEETAVSVTVALVWTGPESIVVQFVGSKLARNLMSGLPLRRHEGIGAS